MTPFILAVLGLAAGSLVSAIVWRTKQQADLRASILELRKQKKPVQDPRSPVQDLSILGGRSQCPRCRHQLSAVDLIPVVSWLVLGGRCRYCHKKIAWHYPVVELVMAGLFLASYYFWPGPLALNGHKVLFVTWLVSLVSLVSLAIYDLRWRELPTKIIYTTAALALAGRLTYIVFYGHQIALDLLKLGLAILIASGLFFLLHEFSKGKWLGFGDVRLGILTGTLLADPALSLLMIFLASLGGTLAALPLLISGQKKLNSQLPYGPHLIAATLVAYLFGAGLINWYQTLLM